MTDQFFGLTDTGKYRKNNEDTFIAELTEDKKFIIACVIDGVGGYAGGEVAAALARETILSRLEKPSDEIIPMLVDCFNLANEKILLEKQSSTDHHNMACVASLAIVDIEQNQFYFVHVGDTRLYLVRDNSLVKISHDQSFVGFLEDSGRLSEEEAMHHPKRNEINKALGLDTHMGIDTDYLETGQSPFLSGDMLLLCSDGLTDMVDSAGISAIITTNHSLKDKCTELVAAANQNGGRDNITVVLVQNNKAQQQYDTAVPAANQKKNDDAIIKTNATGEMPPPKAPRDITNAKANKTPVIILSILLVIFMVATIWQYLQNPNNLTPHTQQIDIPAKKPASALAVKLQAAIDNANGHVLTLSDTAYPTPIIINDAIQISKDTLLIKAKGQIVLQSDSGYTGPAIQLSSKCKNVILDSLSLVNFQVGVASYNNALALVFTRFTGCQAAVQNAYTFADKKYISGKMPVALVRADSILSIKK